MRIYEKLKSMSDEELLLHCVDSRLYANFEAENGITDQEINLCAYALIERIQGYKSEIAALKDFAIWMTGCGYDFCQHEYFVKKRDLLLKA